MDVWSTDMAMNTAKFFKPGHGHPRQGISTWDYEQAVALLPGCLHVSCLWQVMVRQGHVSFLEKETGYQQDVLINPPPLISAEESADRQAQTFAQITAIGQDKSHDPGH